MSFLSEIVSRKFMGSVDQEEWPLGDPLKMKNWRMSMHFNWNNTFGRVLASSVVVLSTATSLYAIPKGPCDPKAPDVCCAEPKPGPFAFAYPMDMNVACPRDFYVHADGLAFQAKQDGLEFGIQDSSGTGAGSPISNGKVLGFSGDNKDWDWNPGIRFGIGFYLDHDAWSLDFNWTWVNITNYQYGNAGSAGGVVIPLQLTGAGLGTQTNTLFGSRSSAKWDTSYNVLDIALGKPYHISRYLVFNPFFGVRAGWIDQHYSVDYAGSNGAAATRTVHHMDNDFWGVGTRAGLNTDWFLGKGWSLFGNVSFAMLFGKFEVDQNLIVGSGVTTNPGEGWDIDFDYYQNTPNLEIAMGIAWGRHFDKMKYHINLKAAYEFVEWFDQLNIRKFYTGSSVNAGNYAANDVVSRGNLTLNGFSFRVQLDI